MIRTLWFHKSAAERHADLPALARGEEAGIRKVAILGAGMMGAGLAFLCAEKGYEVVLKDIRAESLERGMAHVAGQVARLKWLDEAGRAAVLGRVQGTLGLEELRGADLVIEAVFESVEIKHKVTREVEPLLAEGGIWASNTSALPITDLAEVSARPERFIGLHFFSPVEQMPLIERSSSARPAATVQAPMSGPWPAVCLSPAGSARRPSS
jgi:3-hydroxyacyl-CoA dehydrogenase/enoyl-CoA hydratase/3-hydroxybutyryl-CoA epimerase